MVLRHESATRLNRWFHRLGLLVARYRRHGCGRGPLLRASEDRGEESTPAKSVPVMITASTDSSGDPGDGS